jgi:hypothetical protein
MKKALTVSFMLFANIMLLAHLAVPHHDHDNKIVFSCNKNHQHNGNENDSFDCILSKMCMRFGSDNQLLPCLDFNIDPSSFRLPFVSVNISVDINELEGLPFSPKPCLLSCYSATVSQSIGLRAPPVC